MPPRQSTSKKPSHALIRLPSRGAGSVAYETPGLPDAWWALREPPELPEGPLTFIDRPDPGHKGLRATKPAVRVLPTGDHLQQLVVDRALAKHFAGVAGVTLRPTTLRDAKGVVAKDLVIVEVHARVPLDRRVARARYARGWLVAVEEAIWTAPPRAPIFRLLDRPRYLFAERALAETLGVTLDRYEEKLDQGAFPPGWSLAERVPPLGDGRAAEAAFWALYAGDAKARKQALSHPWWAFAVAACVDQAPADDTRSAAARAPIVAARYATEIDRGPHAATRAAVARSGLAAQHYAAHVELAIDPAWRPKILDEAGHDAGTLATEEQRLDALAHWLRGEAPAAETPGAPRAYPPHDRPRFAPKGPRHDRLDAAVRSDIDAFIPRGYQRLGLSDDPEIDEVVVRVHEAIDALRTKRPKPGAKAKTAAQMELGCAWGEQLHRAFGWQWANVKWDGGEAIGLVSPDRALVHYPFVFVGALLGRGSNTLRLLFEMLAAGKTPGAARGSYTTLA